MLWIAATVSLSLSLFAKLLADHFLTIRIPIAGSFAGLQYVENPGVAFSITFPGNWRTIFMSIALFVLLLAAFHAKTTWSRASFGVIVGGALGNVVDRMLDGMVTDYFQIGRFPVFNVADSFITIGVTLLLIEAFTQYVTKNFRSQNPETK